MCGNHNAANLREASVFLRIIEKLRLTEQEQREIEFTSNGQSYNWKPQLNGYATKSVELESDEAKALAAAIELGYPYSRSRCGLVGSSCRAASRCEDFRW
jgi:hypothetical protein